MFRNRRIPEVTLRVAIALCMMLIFAVDCLTRRGLAVGVGYVGAVWLAHLDHHRHRLPVWVAAICSVLIVLGTFVSPGHADLAETLLNRGLLLTIIWLAAYISLRVNRIERLLWISEWRSRMIVESALDAVIAMDEHGLVTVWNERATRLFGWERSEALGRPLEQLIIPAADRERHVQLLKQYLATGQTHVLGRRVEIEAMRRDGSVFPAEMSVTAARDREAVTFSAFVRDITPWKLEEQRYEQAVAEARLLEQATRAIATADGFEQSLRSCLETLCRGAQWPAGHVFLPDPTHRYLMSTEIWYVEDPVRFAPLREASHNVKQKPGEGLAGRVWQQREPLWFENVENARHVLRGRLERELPIRAGFAFPVLVDGEVVAVIEFFSDQVVPRSEPLLQLVARVGERIGELIMHQMWEEQRARLAAIVDTSYDAIIGQSLEGVILTWNRGAERMYGYSEDEALGKTMALLEIPDDALDARLREQLASGRRIEQIETVRRCKNGRLIPVSLTVSPIVDSGGRVIGSATIERDISERKRAEAELRQAKETAEAASQARSEFLANVSHELRTPINAILGMTQLALEEPIPDDIRDYVMTAHNSAESLLSLLNDILDFSRLESGKFRIAHESFRLHDVVDETVRTLAATAFEKGLEMACEMEPDLPRYVVGDPLRLRQILTNLITNAVKFTERGEILVGLRLIRRWPTEVRVRFSVRDTGIGITEADQKRIFEPFTQADSSSTRRYGGTGLGLAICSELLRLMGSRLELQSCAGKGSEFSFVLSLPIADSEPEDRVPPIPWEKLRRIAVLAVDDNNTSRRILGEMLRTWSMLPVLASSAAEALESVRDMRGRGEDVRLIIVDTEMPGVSGFDLVGQLASEFGDEAPRVIALISPAERHAGRAPGEVLGVDEWITKPVSQTELLEAILRVFELPRPARVGASSPNVGDPPPAKLTVLLAEDTPANQKVVTSILRKRGHDVVVATNGEEALEEFGRHYFDVVLMDVQMPVLDGYQATGAIRRMERAAHRNPTPIIALTAHAMRGDRERCLEAGMDAYLAKPIDVRQLITLVESVAEDSNGEPTTMFFEGLESERPLERPPSHRVVNVDAALKRLGNDMDLFREFAGFFTEDAPPLFEKIQAAFHAGDTQALARAAHSLKGLAANLGAELVVEAAKDLELLGKEGALDRAGERLRELATEMQRVDDELKHYR